MLDLQITNTVQKAENKWSANARTHFHCEITETAEHSDPDLLINYRNLYHIRSWQCWRCEQPDWCVFLKMNTCRPWPYIPPSIASQQPRREWGRAVWWTSSTGERPRQWYLIRLPHPSTGRRTMREKKKPKICHIPALNTGTECKEMRAVFPVTPTPPLPSPSPPPSILI